MRKDRKNEGRKERKDGIKERRNKEKRIKGWRVGKYERTNQQTNERTKEEMNEKGKK